jgi:exonuclease SbcC
MRKVSKVKIKNLLGITEMELDSSSIELTGKKGAGKTSAIDALRYALTNDSGREYLIRDGADEGEVIVELLDGLTIDRRKRKGKADYKSIKDAHGEVASPESFLKTIFTPLQLNPIEFKHMSRQEQNRAILDLIDFKWDINWIKEQFGEIPQGVNYEQNILQVLYDIQKDEGVYFQERQDVNRDIRNKKAIIEDIAKDIPANYQAEKWEAYSIADKSRELAEAQEANSKMERAKAFRDAYDNKKRALEADREIAIVAEEKAIANEKEGLKSTIERLKAEIVAAEEKLETMDERLSDKVKVIEAEHNEQLAKLQKDMKLADEYANKQPVDVAPLKAEIDHAETMKKHLNEYKRMKDMQANLESLIAASEEYTRKIELARELPGQILKDANMPIEGLTIKDGIPLVNGLPVSNLSDGEKLDLCVDVAAAKIDGLKIILIDGTEKLDDESRERLYKKCLSHGLQIIATRTTSDDELTITALDDEVAA